MVDQCIERRKAAGFTLIELIIVVAIVGILAVLAIYGVRDYIANTKTAEATNALGLISAGRPHGLRARRNGRHGADAGHLIRSRPALSAPPPRPACRRRRRRSRARSTSRRSPTGWSTLLPAAASLASSSRWMPPSTTCTRTASPGLGSPDDDLHCDSPGRSERRWDPVALQPHRLGHHRADDRRGAQPHGGPAARLTYDGPGHVRHRSRSQLRQGQLRLFV